MAASKGRVVFAASVAQKPRQGGHTWVFLQYLLGFRQLGWDVLFLDRLEPEMCVDEAGRSCSLDRSVNLSYLQNVMERFGLADSYALLYDRGQEVIGRSRDDLLAWTRGADFLLNVMGFMDDEAVLGAVPLRVFLDIDPGFPQMWRDLGLADLFRGHDVFVTIGERIGQSGCPIPACGLSWITTPQSVVLAHWPAQSGMGEKFTDIGAWRGPYAPISYRGAIYGLRVHEFRAFAGLPRRRSDQAFEMALDIHPADHADRDLLERNGWSLVAPVDVAPDPDAYRSYVQESKAEFVVAKNMYVRAKSGWFSDRSICYLASGRPVVAQDTGLADRYPLGEGLLAFATLDEAAAAVGAVAADHPRHSCAARAIAEAYFDSDKILTHLLDKISGSPSWD